METTSSRYRLLWGVVVAVIVVAGQGSCHTPQTEDYKLSAHKDVVAVKVLTARLPVRKATSSRKQTSTRVTVTTSRHTTDDCPDSETSTGCTCSRTSCDASSTTNARASTYSTTTCTSDMDITPAPPVTTEHPTPASPTSTTGTTPTDTATTDTTTEQLPTDCQAVYEAGGTKNGVYTIRPEGSDTHINVYCEQESFEGGWTVFQRRFDGSVDFFRPWAEYKHGFGNISGEFWLGNDYIHMMTANRGQMLKIELGCEGEVQYADYSAFSIDGETLQYKLHVSGYTGGNTLGDSLARYHNGQNFSTWDRDNEDDDRNCANVYHGAWWFRDCHTSNLNGRYGSEEHSEGMNWDSWRGLKVSMSSTKMMMKPAP